MKLTFLGATGTVTGSKYLLTAGTRTVLIDCGLFQGYKQLRLRNWAPLPRDARAIDAVVLTHAHIDHSGYLPLLVKKGFAGSIYCSEATADLCAILLPDSGHLQEEEAAYANKHGFSKHKPALPLYTRADAEQSLKRFRPVSFDTNVDLGNGLSFSLAPSGHILGSSFVRLQRQGVSIVFSGDLGRDDDEIMVAPSRIDEAHYLVLESTYGNRVHERRDPKEQLAEVINRTYARGGIVIMPSFAVGRAQTLLYLVHQLKALGRIPDLPVFLNSPMAANVNRIYHAHRGEHRLTPEQCDAMCGAARIVNTPEESRRLNTLDTAAVIIAASGMATGGRVVHHLKAFAPDPRNTLLFPGFQAGGTRGAAIVQGAKTVKIHGEYIPVRAEVAVMHSLSAHADRDGILHWLDGFQTPPRHTYITHGEPAAADGLRLRIEELLHWPCSVPDYRDEVQLS